METSSSSITRTPAHASWNCKKALARGYHRISYKDAEASLPPPAKPGSIPNPGLEERGTLIVLDDDPTGTQTVHYVNFLTTFEKEVLVDQFKTREPGFLVLTNSRAYQHNEVRCVPFTFPEMRSVNAMA